MDLFELKRSATESAELAILTCGCGVPGCAGFHEGIRVEHDAGVVAWTAQADFYPTPARRGHRDYRAQPARTLRYRFDRVGYVAAIGCALETLRAHPRRHTAVAGAWATYPKSEMAKVFGETAPG